jgi:hypothetical protein
VRAYSGKEVTLQVQDRIHTPDSKGSKGSDLLRQTVACAFFDRSFFRLISQCDLAGFLTGIGGISMLVANAS